MRKFFPISYKRMLPYIGHGLIHCHEYGLIAHQDLKPENIFVFDLQVEATNLPEGRVWRIPKIADFGSVNLASEIGEYRGTRPYMAPEQWNEQPLGRHTSVWSLGLIGYELLSFGNHPIGERTRPWRDGKNKKWQKDKIWTRWVKTGCLIAEPLENLQLNSLISRSLGIDPNSRPTLQEFVDAVINCLAGYSASDASQATFRISYAGNVAGFDHDWPYLDARFNGVVDSLAAFFDDSEISRTFRVESDGQPVS